MSIRSATACNDERLFGYQQNLLFSLNDAKARKGERGREEEVTMMFNPIIKRILRLANVNSNSPYTLTNSKLLTISKIPNMVIHAGEGTCVFQNSIITALVEY